MGLAGRNPFEVVGSIRGRRCRSRWCGKYSSPVPPTRPPRPPPAAPHRGRGAELPGQLGSDQPLPPACFAPRPQNARQSPAPRPGAT